LSILFTICWRRLPRDQQLLIKILRNVRGGIESDQVEKNLGPAAPSQLSKLFRNGFVVSLLSVGSGTYKKWRS
jgi:hypothetical protein